MNPLKELVTELGSLSREQVALRFMIVLSLLGFTVVLLIAGESSVYAMVVLSLLSALCVLNPHTALPAAVMLYCLAVWWVGVPEPFNPWCVPAGLCLMVLHTACALTSAFPAPATVPRALLAQYAVRLGLVAGATVLLSLVAWTHEALGYGGGLVAVLAGLLALGLALGTYYAVVTLAQGDGSP
ncbi:hypothetical protein FNH13_14300 [Ornithinimicrobium ciconiae]|uniref:Uncharacterized protein n=1 Tax=Ornithinimicrobium ciconiae TaxID=2594265 RepID=A0A516GCX8_9MICO|nr:hypothetical protein [Ornithinimicrobium ciconiae]QDO89357.1 hypothetical protein FNH13_14300 [Ornithinimicrobium ciconiae]